MAITVKAMEEALVDIGLMRTDLYGPTGEDDVPGGNKEPDAEAVDRVKRTAAKARMLEKAPPTSFLAGNPSQSVLGMLRASQEDLRNDDLQFELAGSGLQNAMIDRSQILVERRNEDHRDS